MANQEDITKIALGKEVGQVSTGQNAIGEITMIALEFTDGSVLKITMPRNVECRKA
jgi:hypothetical protein